MCNVYRSSGANCTNGPSKDCNCAILIHPDPNKTEWQIFEPSFHPNPAMAIPQFKVVHRLIGCDQIYTSIEPIVENPFEGHTGKFMFGGNFLWSSDSRFRELSAQPLPIHDRYEPFNEYPNCFIYGDD